MCQISKKTQRFHLLSKDRTVWKVVYRGSTPEDVVSLHQKFPYILGERQSMPLSSIKGDSWTDDDGVTIYNTGFHSFRSRKGAFVEMTETRMEESTDESIIVKCILPKGAHIVLGRYERYYLPGVMPTIVSDSIVLKEIVQL